MKRLLILFCLLTAPAFAAPGVMLKNDELRAAAGSAAAGIGRVAKGASVNVLARQGGWTQIRAGGKTGWVRILSVRINASASAADLAGLVAAGSKRDPGKVVAVAGLRGLNEEQLRLARFNAGELVLLNHFVAGRAEAEQFAQSAGLRRAAIGYLSKPKAEQASGKASPWSEGGL